MDLLPTSIDFRALFASSPNAYVLLDQKLDIVWMNEAYLTATMRERDAILGKPMFEAFPSDPASDSHRLLESSLRRVVETGENDEIALIRYDIVGRDGSMDQRYWSATHTALHDASGNTAYILQHTVDVTELQGLRAMRDEMGIVDRASAVQARNLDLMVESEQLKQLFEQTPGFLAVLGGPDHEFRIANGAYLRLIGQRDVVGKPLAEALPEVVAQGFVALLDEVYRTGTPYIGSAERVVLENEGDGPPEERFLDFIYQPIFAQGGVVTGVLVQGHDVTDEVAARDQQNLLINELNHRVKNTLAVVQGLASQSFKEVPGSIAAQNTFNLRLQALAAAHNLLTKRNWQAARLHDTIRNALEAATGSDVARVSLSGPDIELAPQVAISAAMLVHELSTNARKYGALATETGRIDVSWTFEHRTGSQRLAIDWIESGGPVVAAPLRRGFGTRLIERGITSVLGGSADLKFAPEGLRCAVVVDLPSVDEPMAQDLP